MDKMKINLKRAKRYEKAQVPELKKLYELEILRAKEKEWCNLLKEVNTTNEQFNLSKKILKIRSDTNIPLLRGPDGSQAKNKTESIEILLDSMFPDLIRTNSVFESRVNSETLNTPSAGARARIEPEITNDEIMTAIQNTQPDKCPGIDGYPGLLYKETCLLYTSPSPRD